MLKNVGASDVAELAIKSDSDPLGRPALTALNVSYIGVGWFLSDLS